MQTDVGVAHFAFDLGPRDEGGDRVDDQDVDGAGTNELLGDLQSLFAVVRLCDEERVDVDAEVGGVDGVEGVFRVDEGGFAAEFLCFCDGVQREGGLTGGLRSVDLDDAAPGKSADAGGGVEGQGAGGDGLHVHVLAVSQAHDGAFAVGAFDLSDRGV